MLKKITVYTFSANNVSQSFISKGDAEKAKAILDKFSVTSTEIETKKVEVKLDI